MYYHSMAFAWRKMSGASSILIRKLPSSRGGGGGRGGAGGAMVILAVAARRVVTQGAPGGALLRRRLSVAPPRSSLQARQKATRSFFNEPPATTSTSTTSPSPAAGVAGAGLTQEPVGKGIPGAKDNEAGASGTSGAEAGTAAVSPTTTAGAGEAAREAATAERTVGAGVKGDAATISPNSTDDEIWIVGRVLQRFDDRLGAKRDKIRERELGVIDRFSSLISTLDSSVEARDDDEFLAWLNSLKIPQPSALADHPTSASSGSGDTSTGADERNRVKQFFSDAEKRLSGFVAFKEDMLFRDRESRRETDRDKEAPARVEVGVTAGKKATYLPKLPEEELYQIRLTAHRAMLSNCLSLVSERLEKQHLKAGLTVQEVAAATRSLYLAAPEDRLKALFPLFDVHGDGHLDADSLERVVDTTILPLTTATQRCYAAAARAALDKKAGGAMSKTMKYTLWDVLEVPVKRRCAFAWAKERKQVGPDEWRVSWEQFKPSRRDNFPEFESVAGNYLAEYRRRRAEWHNIRRGRKRAAVYGTALFTAVVLLDNITGIV